MLALARGFRATIISSGLPQNAIVQQAGSDSEMTSAVQLDDVRVVEDMPQVVRQGRRCAGERRGRRHRRAAPARHRQRRQRADARRLAARAPGARQRPHRPGPFSPAGPVRDRRRRECRQGLPGARPWRHGAHRTRDVDGGRHHGRRRQRVRLRGLGRRRRPQRQLRPPGGRVPVGHGATAIRGRVSGLREGHQGRPAARNAGLARAGVLRQPVGNGQHAHHGAGRYGRHRDGDLER